MSLGSNIKELRGKLNLTQKEFAEKLSLSNATITAWEKDAKKPSYDVLIQLATTFNVSLDWLCGIDNSDDIKIETWTDAIRVILALCNTDLFFSISSDEVHSSLSFYNFIGFENPYDGTPYGLNHVPIEEDGIFLDSCHNPVAAFLSGYKKTLSLYQEGIIDKELLDAWMEKQMRNYNYSIEWFYDHNKAGDFNVHNNET